MVVATSSKVRSICSWGERPSMRWLRPEIASCAASRGSPALASRATEAIWGEVSRERKRRKGPRSSSSAATSRTKKGCSCSAASWAVASSIRVLPMPASPSRTTAVSPVAGVASSCWETTSSSLGPSHHRTLGAGGAGVEGGSRGGPGLPGHPLAVGRLVPPQHLEEPPSVGKALEPEQPPVDDPGVAQCPGEVLDHLRDQDLTTLSLVGDPGGGVDRGAVGVTGGLGDVAAVQTHPHRQRHVGVGPVVILDGPSGSRWRPESPGWPRRTAP